MRMPIQVSKLGIDTIKQIESFQPKAYWDHKQWSIGYGTKAFSADEVIDKNEATKRLITHLTYQVEPIINRTIHKSINQNQFDAIASFIYNIGSTAFQKSTFLKRLNYEENIEKVAKEEFKRWVYAGGEKSKGLLNRRKKETELFIKKKRTMLEVIKMQMRELSIGGVFLAIATIGALIISGIITGKQKAKSIFSGKFGKRLKTTLYAIIGIAISGFVWVVYEVLGDDFKMMGEDK